MQQIELPLPDQDDPGAIFRFAMSFNGYEEFGSFEASAEAAKQQRRSSLRELRNELFFAARASRHCGDDDYVAVYREIAPLILAFAQQA